MSITNRHETSGALMDRIKAIREAMVHQPLMAVDQNGVPSYQHSEYLGEWDNWNNWNNWNNWQNWDNWKNS